MRLVGYVRVSRVAGREGESFISTSVQRERIEGFAVANGHSVVAWHEDLDQPGSNMDRPGFTDAMELVKTGQADGLIVARMNRFARSILGAAIAIRDLEAAGGQLVAVDLGVDPTTPTGKLARSILLALAEFELETIRESWGTARARAIARGVHISRVPPVGYAKAADSRLVPDPIAAPVIRELFVRRAAGHGLKQLAIWLDEALPHTTGQWTAGTVQSIFARRTYLGEAHSGELVNADAHEPLVTSAEWLAAQNVRTYSPRRGEGTLLQGIVRCANCSQVLTRNTGGRANHPRYDCQKRHSRGTCPEPVGIGMKRLDAFVDAAFLTWLERSPVVLEGTAEKVVGARTELEDAQVELVAYRDGQLISVLGEDAFLEGLRERVRTVEGAWAAYGRAQKAADLSGMVGMRFDLREEWPNLTISERRLILGTAIEGVYVRRSHLGGGRRPPVEDRVAIVWGGSGGRLRLPIQQFSWPPRDHPGDAGFAVAHDREVHPLNR